MIETAALLDHSWSLREILMTAVVVIFIFWNIYNTYQTKSSKRRDIRREEFNSNIRPTIQRALDDLASARTLILNFSDSTLAGDAFTSELYKIQEDQFTPAYQKLDTALTRADGNKHVNSDGWRQVLTIAEDKI